MFWNFFKKKQTLISFDSSVEEPVIRIGCCTGEKILGFRNLKTGKFREVMLITREKELDDFCKKYGLHKNDIPEIVLEA